MIRIVVLGLPPAGCGQDASEEGLIRSKVSVKSRQSQNKGKDEDKDKDKDEEEDEDEDRHIVKLLPPR